jgi:hypothetical protein
MTDPVISVPHFTPTFSEALEAEWHASLGTLRKAGISIGVLLVLLSFVAIAHRGDGSMVSFFAGVVVFVSSLFAIWFVIALFVAARRISKHNETTGCSGYKFSAEGVDIANNVASVHVSWPGLHDFHRSKRLLMFRPRESKLLFFIPMRCIEERDRVPLERLLSDGCAPTE